MNLEQIYERHADFVWRTLRRLGVAEGDARDATHDVFLIVHAELARFEGRSSLNTWLFTICRSVAARLSPTPLGAAGQPSGGFLEEFMYNLWHPDTHWYPVEGSADFPTNDVVMHVDWLSFEPE
jgi:hypothetical protein